MSILNPELLQLAKEQAKAAAVSKESFVDPAMAAGGGVPPMDPAMAGGGMPMDPAMMGGAPPMDPAMMGGAPPMDPSLAGAAPPAGGGGGGMTPEDVKAIVQEVMAQQGAGGQQGGGEKKMKVDVNQEIYQIKKLLALMAEELGIPVPPTLLLGDPAQDPHIPDSEAAKDPLSAASASQPKSAIPPIEPMPAASPALAAGAEGKSASVHRGHAVDMQVPTARQTTDKARALLAQLNAAQR